MIVINTGATANDGTGDKLRDAFIIVNQNFLDIQDILDVVLTDSSIIPISQISGLQTILDDLSYQVSLIPGLQDDINSINSTIFTINQTLNSQNSSINELYSLVNDLQQQIFTKIGEAPIDGQEYVRKDAEWVVATGVTFSQLLENVTPDGYLGLRLQPASASNNGFYINKSTNQSVGYYARNTDNVGNAAVSALYLGGSGGLYDNYVSLFHANAGYSIPYLSNKNGLISNNDLFFIGWQGASFDFVTSTGTFGSETSKFRITNSGTVSIGVTPSLDNTTTDILGRKSDGTIVRIDKSSIPVLSLDELTDVEITSPTNNQIPAYESATNLWKNKTIVEDAIVNGVIDKAPSQNAVFDALDLTRRLIVSNTGSTVTGTVAETILTSMVVSANTLDTVCDLFITLDYNKNTANAIPMKLYYNTSNSLAGATQISFYNTGSNRNGGFNRKFVVKGTSMDLITTVPTITQLNNQFIDAIFAASTVITIAPTGNIYFIFTVANDAVGTTFINKRATVEKMKLS